jgi:hypothetical protein
MLHSFSSAFCAPYPALLTACQTFTLLANTTKQVDDLSNLVHKKLQIEVLFCELFLNLPDLHLL